MKRLLRTDFNRFDYTTINHIDISLSSKCEFTNTKFASYIVDCVNKTLGKYTTKWFLEYSILASTIDPDINKLCCVSIVNGDDKFVNSIEKYIKTIISVLSKDSEDDWWFHNPETFILPSQENKFLSLSSDLGSLSLDPNLISLISRSSEITKANEYEYVDDISSFISLMEYDRTFEKMLQEAGKIMKRYNTSSRLIEHYQYGVTLARSYYDYFIKQESENFGYYTFPILAAKSTQSLPDIYKNAFGLVEDRLQGQGHFFIYFDLKDTVNREELEGVLDVLYNEIHIIIHWLYLNYTFNIGLILQEKILRESLKSAKAAIMSRNMSHNLGSHVMFYIKQKLQSVSKIVDNKVLANIIPGELYDLKTIEEKIKENKDIELPFLVGLGRFINYLQERQDYIATVATDYIPARSTISFKDFIYDELKPDLRYQRHHSDGSSSDAGWQSGNLLLDYIAYSEQYRKSEDIEIRFGQFNGTNPITNSDADKDFQALRKFNIAVPGGVIGRQAIFSIFENIIRNAAKHSGRRGDGKMVLELSLLKEENEKLKLDMVENLCCKRVDNDNEEKGQDLLDKYSKYKDTYHVLRIKIDMPNKEEDIDNLVSKLGEKYVEAGSMVETSKGLKEMRISAAWLRGYSMDSEIPADEPPVLSIYSEPYEGGNYALSYILCIPKPRKVAFVLKEKNKQWEDLNNVIKPFGCEVFVIENINKYEKLADIISNFEVVCMPSDYKDTICPSISSRYIADDEKIKEILGALSNCNRDEQKLKETIRGIYRIWFEATYPNSNSQLVIADEKASTDKEAECKKLNEGKQDNDKVILKKTSEMAQNDCTDNVVYSTHFKGLGFDTTDYGQMLTASACIESVTGNNSTARLVRQDEWNEEWQYKLLSSGLAKVAIFDERIFSSFIMRDSASKHDKLFPTIDDIRNAKEEKQEQDFYDYLKGYGIHEDDASDIYYNLSTIEEIIACYSDIYKYNCDVAQRNHERHIYAFDISNVGENKVDIVGYNVNIGKRVGAYVNHEKDAIVTIAHMTYENDVTIVLTDKGQEIFGSDKGNIFDYITIHQGVLDKIYTAFGIKNNAIEKHKVTHALHSCFSKHNTPEDKQAFLPSFIIHSGRSKPSAADMPQHQPFVQFAAVDHAVKDCKYTLVELLATAHYEEGNSNK